MKLVVIAEDDDSLRDVLTEVVEGLGYRVLALEDGYELADFLDFASRRPPELVLADVRMPGLSGFEAVERARARGMSFPVLMLTARPDAEAALRTASLSNARLMPKPTRIEELVAHVRSAVCQTGAV